jgi:hypothetical protein
MIGFYDLFGLLKPVVVLCIGIRLLEAEFFCCEKVDRGLVIGGFISFVLEPLVGRIFWLDGLDNEKVL